MGTAIKFVTLSINSLTVQTVRESSRRHSRRFLWRRNEICCSQDCHLLRLQSKVVANSLSTGDRTLLENIPFGQVPTKYVQITNGISPNRTMFPWDVFQNNQKTIRSDDSASQTRQRSHLVIEAVRTHLKYEEFLGKDWRHFRCYKHDLTAET